VFGWPASLDLLTQDEKDAMHRVGRWRTVTGSPSRVRVAKRRNCVYVVGFVVSASDHLRLPPLLAILQAADSLKLTKEKK
jgi:hypothetical protein